MSRGLEMCIRDRFLSHLGLSMTKAKFESMISP
jgi:hypothetical protein